MSVKKSIYVYMPMNQSFGRLCYIVKIHKIVIVPIYTCTYVIVLCLCKTLYVCLPPFLCMKCCPACLYFSSYCLLAGRPSQPFVYVYQPVYHCPPLGGGICKTPIPVQKKIISILEAQILCCLHHFVFDFVTCFVTKR